MKVAPAPGADSQRISPPWSRTMAFAVASPSPVPNVPFVVKKGSKRRARVAASRPVPLSPTRTRTQALSASFVMSSLTSILGDVTEAGYAKTAFGLRDWAPDKCVGEVALPRATVTTGLPAMTPREAAERGARSLGIGATLLRSWKDALAKAPEQAFPGQGNRTALDDEMHRLRAENKRLQAERDILTKALACFAKDAT